MLQLVCLLRRVRAPGGRGGAKNFGEGLDWVRSVRYTGCTSLGKELRTQPVLRRGACLHSVASWCAMMSCSELLAGQLVTLQSQETQVSLKKSCNLYKTCRIGLINLACHPTADGRQVVPCGRGNLVNIASAQRDAWSPAACACTIPCSEPL